MGQCRYCICYEADPNTGSAVCILDRHKISKSWQERSCDSFVFNPEIKIAEGGAVEEAKPVFHAEDLDVFNKLRAKERVNEAFNELQDAIDEHKQGKKLEEQRKESLEVIKGIPRYGMRGNVLLDAFSVINGERRDAYGDAENSFQAIAKLWSAYLATKFGSEDFTVDEGDVALLMVQFKLGRILSGYNVQDSFKDAAGYMGLGADIIERTWPNSGKGD